MIGCLRTRVRKQPIIGLYFESENELKIYNLEASIAIFEKSALIVSLVIGPRFTHLSSINFIDELAFRLHSDQAA